MIPLTATIITYNEERNIRDCLKTLTWVPNIVVVDSGSTDRTAEIAREYCDRVIVTDWPGHVKQKNGSRKPRRWRTCRSSWTSRHDPLWRTCH